MLNVDLAHNKCCSKFHSLFIHHNREQLTDSLVKWVRNQVTPESFFVLAIRFDIKDFLNLELSEYSSQIHFLDAEFLAKELASAADEFQIAKFQELIEFPVRELTEQGRDVYVFGEVVDVLSANGYLKSAVAMEKCAPAMVEKYQTHILCGYAKHNIEELSLVQDLHDHSLTHFALNSQDSKLSHYVANLELLNDLVQANTIYQLGMMHAKLAHELKNALSLCMASSHLAGEFLVKDNPQVNKLKAMVERSQLRMKQLIQDILNFSKLDSSQFKLINLSAMTKTIEDFFEQTQTRDIKLLVKIDKADLAIMGQESLVESLLLNLILNATQASGVSTIELNCHRDNENIVITVFDNGQGMTSQELKHVFDPFYSTKKNMGGIGLGLTFCREIVYKHNGSITIDSTNGSGTQVQLIFPKA